MKEWSPLTALNSKEFLWNFRWC